MLNTEQFASDNYSGICPEALEKLAQANSGSAPAYGNDIYTKMACDAFRELFETDCEVYFVFNGTAANSLALASLCQSYHSIICHELAHIETDECGAPEFFSNGSKLLLAKGENGKVTPKDIEELVTRRDDLHYPKPKVISLTQSSEVGTVYSVEELNNIRHVAKKYNLRVHMDGARFANAVASTHNTPAELTWKSGVDVLCFCGTKNGMSMGEAIVFFDKELAQDFEWRCKQAGQLASKMRFISAQWLGLLENNTWLKNANHANAMARYLANKLTSIKGITLMFEPEANSVFLELEPRFIKALKAKEWLFYTFIGSGGVRFVTSWDSTKERIEELYNDLKNIIEPS